MAHPRRVRAARRPAAAWRRGSRGAAAARRRRSALHAALFLATVYGGYFGAGLGIMLLAILGVFVDDGLQRLNALKGLMSLLVAVVGAVAFAVFGPVAWDAAAIVGATCLLGGAAGVGVARRLPAAVLRGVVIAYGVVVAIVLLV